MALSRVTNPSAGDTITSSAWKSEFDNIYNNSLSLISPLTGDLNAGGNDITTVDEIAFSDAAADATAAGRIRRNSTALTFHNGTSAVDLTANDNDLVLIEAQSAANDATIDFTTGIDSTYDVYLLTMTNVIPATDAVTIALRVSQSATFLSGSTDYQFLYNTDFVGSTLAHSDSGAGSSAMTMAANLDNSSAAHFNARVWFCAPANTAVHKGFRWETQYENPSTMVMTFGSGSLKLNTTAIDGIRVVMSAGNITSGEFALYGVVKA